jgi:hypothetical protein
MFAERRDLAKHSRVIEVVVNYELLEVLHDPRTWLSTSGEDRILVDPTAQKLTFMEPCIANVFLSTTKEMQPYTMFFIVVSALHVSSYFSAHHQELKNCTCSIGTCQTCVLLPLVWLSRSLFILLQN